MVVFNGGKERAILNRTRRIEKRKTKKNQLNTSYTTTILDTNNIGSPGVCVCVR
jgi:hypothetical protein